MKNLSIIIIGLLATSIVGAAWLPPTEAPTGGNVATPINATSTDQTKVGALSLGAFSSTSSAVFDHISEEVKLGINTNDPQYSVDVVGTLNASLIISGTYPAGSTDIATKEYVDTSAGPASSPSVTIVQDSGDNNYFPVSVSCPSGTYMVGGGHSRTGSDYTEIASFPDTNGWTTICGGMSPPGSCNVYATCYSQ